MKSLFGTLVFFSLAAGLYSCSKSASGPQTQNPVDTTRVPVSPSVAYTYDSSFKSTGSFATMGVLQADGKIIIANPTQVARLNHDGTLDASFATGSTANGEFHSLALQKDGKVLLGGSFTSYNGQSKAYYLRLNPDGSIDNSFALLPLTSVSSQPLIDVRSIAVQADNKILLGGNFFYIVSTVNGVSTGQRQIMRVSESGAYDASFQHNVTAAFVNCMRILSDGKILVTGQSLIARIPATVMTPVDQNFNYIAKLNADGSVDPSFKWPTTVFAMRSPYTFLPAYGQAITVLEDGKILLGGRFQTTSTVFDDDYSGLVRLTAGGAIDRTFPKRAFTGVVSTVCLAADRIVIGTMHDPERTYQDANIAINQMNKDGSDNENYKANNFSGYGDTYMVLEDTSKNLYLIGKFYDKITAAVYTFHGVVRLKRL